MVPYGTIGILSCVFGLCFLEILGKTSVFEFVFHRQNLVFKKLLKFSCLKLPIFENFDRKNCFFINRPAILLFLNGVFEIFHHYCIFKSNFRQKWCLSVVFSTDLNRSDLISCTIWYHRNGAMVWCLRFKS